MYQVRLKREAKKNSCRLQKQFWIVLSSTEQRSRGHSRRTPGTRKARPVRPDLISLVLGGTICAGSAAAVCPEKDLLPPIGLPGPRGIAFSGFSRSTSPNGRRTDRGSTTPSSGRRIARSEIPAPPGDQRVDLSRALGAMLKNDSAAAYRQGGTHRASVRRRAASNPGGCT